MKSKGLSQMSFWLSVVAVVLAVVDALGVGMWLAASSWLLVAVVLGVWAVYTDQ